MIHCETVSATERLHLDLDDAGVHMHVVGVFVFERGPLAQGAGVDFDRIRECVATRLYRVPRARQRLVETPLTGEPVWVDDRSFNLLYHVRHIHLPQPGDERQLKRLCGQIGSQRLDRERPLWELHVIEGLEDDRFAVVVKAHQAITDGVWSLDLAEALLAGGAEPDPVEATPPPWLPRAAPSPDDLLRRAVTRRMEAPLHVGRMLFEAVRDPEAAGEAIRSAWAGLRDAAPSSETPFNRRLGPHRRVDWTVCDAERAQRVADVFETDLESVVLSTLAGAIGLFFERRGIPRADQRDFRLRAAMPENAGGLLDGDKTGDALAWLVAALPIAEPDARARLEHVSRGLEASTHVGYEDFAAAGEALWPGLYAALAKRQLERRASNLTVAVMSGPASERHLLGAPLRAAFPILPLVPDQALRLGLYVRGADLHWGFNAEWDLLPDLHDLVGFIEQCFDDLCAAADVRAA